MELADQDGTGMHEDNEGVSGGRQEQGRVWGSGAGNSSRAAYAWT